MAEPCNKMFESTDEAYMRRCIALARLGMGHVHPNPMVGAVIVHNGRIIGEGYHQMYGGPHAEVNAIRSVNNPEILKESTIYVSLEPCSHYGKTPPCADKLIEMGFLRVVVGATDPHDKVNGKGIAKLRSAGIDVTVGVLREECEWLNRRFFTYHRKQRPYVILKWAQTADGFMDIDRTQQPQGSYWITNPELRVLVHKWRSEEPAIVIGYNTYRNDHPALTTRFYPGNSPQRFIMARNAELLPPIDGFTYLPEDPKAVLSTLYEQKINSVIIEGGRQTLLHFIESGLWDEARVLTGQVRWGQGLPAPQLSGDADESIDIHGDSVRIFYHHS